MIRCIQMGRIPIFIYDDIPWVPYLGTNISVETFGFLVGNATQGLVDIVHRLKNLTEEEYQSKLTALRHVRPHFTYEGVLHQIDAFLRDPFGPHGGDLRCVSHPRHERCCEELQTTSSVVTKL